MAKKDKEYIEIIMFDELGAFKDFKSVEVVKSFEYHGVKFSVIKTTTDYERRKHGKYNVVENSTGLMASAERDSFLDKTHLTNHIFYPKPNSVDKCISNAKFNVDIYIATTGVELVEFIEDVRKKQTFRNKKRVIQNHSVYLKLKNMGVWKV